MKRIYNIIITPPEKGEKYFSVYIPACDIWTQGENVVDCMSMARDAVGAWGITLEDLNMPIPEETQLKRETQGDEISALIDVDFALYRKKQDNRTVRKNCTIPQWLNVEAEKRHINFSAVLQNGLLAMISEQ